MKSRNLILIFILFFLFSLPVLSRETPRLTPQNPTFDFGTIEEGMHVEVHFHVKNTGSKEVQIQEIRTFASCVQSRPLPDRVIKPGEKLKLEYIFQSLGYGGVTIHKQIEFHYNNERLSPLKLNVRGKVLALKAYQAPVGELTYNFFVLIDLRSPACFRKNHILGAINIPESKINQWISRISSCFSEELVVYLYSEKGIMSDKVVHRLRKEGYSQFISIVGGIKEWENQLGEKFLVSGKI